LVDDTLAIINFQHRRRALLFIANAILNQVALKTPDDAIACDLDSWLQDCEVVLTIDR